MTYHQAYAVRDVCMYEHMCCLQSHVLCSRSLLINMQIFFPLFVLGGAGLILGCCLILFFVMMQSLRDRVKGIQSKITARNERIKLLLLHG